MGGKAELHPATNKASSMPKSCDFEARTIISKTSGIVKMAQPYSSQSPQPYLQPQYRHTGQILDLSHIILWFDSALRHLGQSLRFFGESPADGRDPNIGESISWIVDS